MATTDFRTTRPDRSAVRRHPWQTIPLSAFAGAATFNLGLVAAISLWIAPPGATVPVLAAIVGFVFAVIVAGFEFARTYPHSELGLCNIITQSRLALATTLLVPLLAPAAGTTWIVFAIAVVGFALDGVDGRLARRSGLSSEFGARFDMEVDAVFAALLAIAALQSGKAGAWVLALGFMRYGYVAAGFVWPWMRSGLPECWRRKAICVVQIGVLIALLAPIVTAPMSEAIAVLATALLSWSFVVDIAWLMRARG